MAIRLRIIKGHLTALCAAKFEAEPGDQYLDDNKHQALAEKFMADRTGSGLIPRELYRTLCGSRRKLKEKKLAIQRELRRELRQLGKEARP